jgi:hypothetical protein
VESKPLPRKKVIFSPKVLGKERLGRHVTRSSVRRKIHVGESIPEMLVQCATEVVVEHQYPS